MSNTVSRVLYQTIIYLDLLLPAGSSSLPGTQRATVLSLSGLAPDGVYTALPCYQGSGKLLPCLFTLTCLKAGGYFLLHYPGSHLHRTLSGILPCEARTFLTRIPSGRPGSQNAAAIIYPTRLFHYKCNLSKIQANCRRNR